MQSGALNQAAIIQAAYQPNSTNTSPANNLNNIAKINARLRARNPAVVNSMQAGSPQMLLPLSQRSLSPATQTLVPNQQQQSQPAPTQNQGFPNSANRPNSYTLNLNIGGMSGKMQGNGLPPSRDLTNQRKILHKSLNSVQADSNNKPLSSHGINMSVQMLQQRRQQSLELKGNDFGDEPNTSGPTQIQLKNKINPNARARRTNRDKSYDLYSQKIQLPPMTNKLSNEASTSGQGFNRASAAKNDRTYSLPNSNLPMSPTSPNSRFNGKFQSNSAHNSIDAQSNSSKGFFSARVQQNQNNLRDEQQEGAPSITSPRRQLQAASQQMAPQGQMSNTMRAQRQKSRDRHQMTQSHGANKPLSPMSETPREPEQQKSTLSHDPSATTKNSDDGKNSSDDDAKEDPNIQFVEVQQLLFGENPPVLNPKTLFLKNHEPTKASSKKCGHIKSYAANTNQGIIREYNEDRVSIILNILKPKSKAKIDVEWPQICFFGVFDGHGGAACADYLRDNLHNFVVQHELFPQHPQEAIKQGFKECERNFLNLVEMAQARAQHQMPGQNVGPERSGSCATVVIVINDTAYVVNVGDSRCIMSMDAGSQTAVLTRDHKPDDEQERLRIQAAGGKIYRTQTFAKAATSPDEKDLYVQGPLRAFPGRLSVSRTFGDIEAKKPKYNGNPNVVVCEPEITTFKLRDNFDFFLIGCDGIFERLNNKDIIGAVWDRISEQTTTRKPDMLTPPHPGKKGGALKSPRGQRTDFHYDEHIAAAEGVEMGLRVTAASRSLDNITILILGLKGLKTTVQRLNEGQTLKQVRRAIRQEQLNIENTYAADFMEVEVNETEEGKK